MYDCKVEIAKREYICKLLYILLQLLQLLQFVLGYMWLQNRFIYDFHRFIFNCSNCSNCSAKCVFS